MLKSIYRSRSGQGDDWGRRQQLWSSQSFHLYYTIREIELRDGAKKPLCKLEMVYVQWRSFTSNQVDCLLALNNWWHCSSFPSIRWLMSCTAGAEWSNGTFCTWPCVSKGTFHQEDCTACFIDGIKPVQFSLHRTAIQDVIVTWQTFQP